MRGQRISDRKIIEIKKLLQTRTQKQAALMAGVSQSVAWKVYHGGYRKILTDQAAVIEIKEKKMRGELFNPNECINWIA